MLGCASGESACPFAEGLQGEGRGGEALLRDPREVRRGWREEAEALFALSPQKIATLCLEYPGELVGMEDGAKGGERGCGLLGGRKGGRGE